MQLFFSDCSEMASKVILKRPMQREPKIFFSSLMAPFASLFVPAILTILTILIDSRIQSDYALDRTAGLLSIVGLSIPNSILVLFIAADGYVLKQIFRSIFTNLLIVYGAACIPVGARLGWPSPFGLKDQITRLANFLSLIVFCLSFGVICWRFAAVGHKRLFKDAR